MTTICPVQQILTDNQTEADQTRELSKYYFKNRTSLEGWQKTAEISNAVGVVLFLGLQDYLSVTTNKVLLCCAIATGIFHTAAYLQKFFCIAIRRLASCEGEKCHAFHLLVNKKSKLDSKNTLIFRIYAVSFLNALFFQSSSFHSYFSDKLIWSLTIIPLLTIRTIQQDLYNEELSEAALNGEFDTVCKQLVNPE
ncbi:MAG: hypothetical protein SNF33_01840 [Candidatus Algichlamydia australiensis]|nr:hypothetical protein [Chlamydiales bacterium]